MYVISIPLCYLNLANSVFVFVSDAAVVGNIVADFTIYD